MNKILFLFITITIAFGSCKKDVLVSSNTKDIPVIQSFLIAGTDSIAVKVSTLKPYSNDLLDTVEPISGLKIYINNALLTEGSTGKYYIKSSALNIEPNDTFNLKLDYNNAPISSQTIIPSVPQNFSISTDTVQVKQMTSSSKGPGEMTFVNLELTWDNPSKDYHFLTIEWLGTTKVYTNSMMSTDDVKTKRVTSSNQDNTYNINQMELGLYGKYRAVLYKINKEYYDLLETTNLNSNDMTNPPSNVSNGWGIFTAMSTDTVYFWVIKK